MTLAVSANPDSSIMGGNKGEDNMLLGGAMYKSYCKLIAICINITLSSLFVGYSLVYTGAFVDFSVIANIYGIAPSDQNTLEGIINGLVPVGAMLGALSSSQIISRFSRRNGFLVTNAIATVGLAILYIKTLPTLIIGRIFQGICTGIFSSIVPLYINEIVTPDSASLGSLNQVLISSGQGFCYLLYFILVNITTVQVTWDIIAEFLLIPILIQTLILIFVFPYNTPKYLYENGLTKQAVKMIALIYKEEFVGEAIGKYENNQSSILTDVGDKVAIKQQLTVVANTKYQNSKMAIFFAIQIALMQQMVGVNVIAVYGKKNLSQIIKDNQNLINLLQVAIATLPALMSAFTIQLMKRKGRKFIVQLGVLVIIVCLLFMVIAFLFHQQLGIASSIMVVGSMVIYMAIFGLTLGPVVWLYIPQIVQPNIVPFSTMVNLSGAAFCIIVFPYFTNTALAFSIFLIWSIVSFLINYKVMVETKDKSRRKIFQEFRTLKIF